MKLNKLGLAMFSFIVIIMAIQLGLLIFNKLAVNNGRITSVIFQERVLATLFGQLTCLAICVFLINKKHIVNFATYTAAGQLLLFLMTSAVAMTQ